MAAAEEAAEVPPAAWPRPSDAAVQRLLEKVGVGSLEEAVGAKTLHWNGEVLDDEDAKVVAYVVATSSSLIWLNLNGNNIGAVGAKALAEALRANRSLSKLWLSNNNHLLGDNGIGDEGAKALRDAVRDRQGFTLRGVADEARLAAVAPGRGPPGR